MYALIPLYILSPFIKKMIDALDRNLVVYLLSLWLFFSAVLPTVAAFLPQSFSSILVLDRRYDLSIMAGYAGYFVAGYYLMRWHRPVRKAWLGVVVLVDVVCIALGTWWKTTALGEYGEVFKTYSGVFVVVLSVALFLLFKELYRERRLSRAGLAVVGFLAPLAFGVYLVHNLLVDLLSRLVPWWPATVGAGGRRLVPRGSRRLDRRRLRDLARQAPVLRAHRAGLPAMVQTDVDAGSDCGARTGPARERHSPGRTAFRRRADQCGRGPLGQRRGADRRDRAAEGMAAGAGQGQTARGARRHSRAARARPSRPSAAP